MLRYTPHLQFVRDTSVAEGDRVLEWLGEMERAGELPPAEDGDDGGGDGGAGADA